MSSAKKSNSLTANNKKEKGRTQSYDDSSDSEEVTSEDEDVSWIQWFCSLKGNEFFCEVDEEFIQDDFNLTGLRSYVPNYDYALDLILDTETEDDLSEEQQEIVDTAAEFLYGLIHARYILTVRGMSAMVEKLQNVEFGRCPRVLCGGQPALPVGQTDVPRTNTVKLFCPKCQDIYYPRLRRHSNIDGAYFGTTFPHLLLQTYPDHQPPPVEQKYIPKIYGFKIHPSARQRQQEYAKQRAKQQLQNAAMAKRSSSATNAVATTSSTPTSATTVTSASTSSVANDVKKR